MPGFIFLPVPTPEMQAFADDWNAGRAAKNKPPYAVLRNRHLHGFRKGLARATGHGALCRLGAGDKLYILCHGNSLGSSAIGARRGATREGQAWVGGTMKRYDADEMARVLEAEGLSKHFVDLRVFACGSANAPANATGPYAQGLAAALRGRGYASIQVTGYQGACKSAYGSRTIPAGNTTLQQHPHALQPATATTHKGVEINGETFPASTKKATY